MAERRWHLPAFVKGVRPVKALTTVVFSAALVGIVANAVLLQKGRHAGLPFDFFHGAAPSAPAPAPGPVASVDPVPTEALPPVPAAAPPPAAAAEPAPAAPRRPSVARHAAAKPEGGDAIGALLGAHPVAGDKAPAKPADGKAAEAKPDPGVLQAQRQLKKLGYAIKPDGRMDGGTRQAIKRFAHDHHLKAEAALTPELRRQIADASSAPSKPANPAAPKAE